MKIAPGLLHVVHSKPSGPRVRQKEHSPIIFFCSDGFVGDGIDGFVGDGILSC